MAARLGLFLLLIFAARPLSPEIVSEIVVWNVGQGAWSTVIADGVCWHFDMGGEKMDWRQLGRRCRGRPNRVTFSHWDMDHIGLAGKARRELPQLCRMNLPAGPSSPFKIRLLSQIPPCAVGLPFPTWEDARAPSVNGRSRVSIFHATIFPGDSTRREEKAWMDRLAGLSGARVLVLGHHGSRTSTSKGLLARLSSLRMAIASQRFRRYGHPHLEVRRLLREFRIPLLLTEEWGTIHFEN
jgi:competence protein ComEC